MSFAEFVAAYEDLIRKVRTNKLTLDDFQGATISLTNPGTIGTVQSVPRLMPGQGVIVGVGAIDFPAEYQAADERTLADLGVSKVVTITSTYDHRVIQGAESGLFLKRVHELLVGEGGFYDSAFTSLGVPYEPVRWRRDVNPADHDDARLQKQMMISTLIRVYRVRGHLIADLDPLKWKAPRMEPELDPATYGLTIWDLDREFLTGGLGGVEQLELGEILRILRDAYCRTIGIEYMHIQDTAEQKWIQEQVEGVRFVLSHEEQLHSDVPPERRRGVREVPGHEVRRTEALRPRRSRIGDRHPRLDPFVGSGRGSRRSGARHAPPRPSERAGEHRRQVLRPDLP